MQHTKNIFSSEIIDDLATVLLKVAPGAANAVIDDIHSQNERIAHEYKSKVLIVCAGSNDDGREFELYSALLPSQEWTLLQLVNNQSSEFGIEFRVPVWDKGSSEWKLGTKWKRMNGHLRVYESAVGIYTYCRKPLPKAFCGDTDFKYNHRAYSTLKELLMHEIELTMTKIRSE